MRKSLFWSSLDKQSRSRMLKDATHRSSTSFLVFTLIQIVMPTGISSLKHQIFSVSYLNRCWFSQLWPCYNCFHLLWVLGAVQRSFIWNIHHYLRLVQDLSCWSWIVQFWSQNHQFSVLEYIEGCKWFLPTLKAHNCLKRHQLNNMLISSSSPYIDVWIRTKIDF